MNLRMQGYKIVKIKSLLRSTSFVTNIIQEQKHNKQTNKQRNGKYEKKKTKVRRKATIVSLHKTKKESVGVFSLFRFPQYSYALET